ncbi:MAG: hypothetical protein IJC78_06585, partial [Clostridia bacterium]|nr:hypothetical protein [Clostridia bacterium]
MNALLLICSVICSGARNIFSKAISDLPFGTKPFFLAQAVSFLCGSAVLSVVLRCDFSANPITVLYAVIYGSLLISAQYCYTSAMKRGNIGVCATVYSLGFIFPTLSGCIFWQESLGVINAFGILLVIPAILLSGLPETSRDKTKKREKTEKTEKT